MVCTFKGIHPSVLPLSLAVYVSLSLCYICMVAEQLCMADRARCLLVVGGVLQGQLSKTFDYSNGTLLPGAQGRKRRRGGMTDGDLKGLMVILR